MNKSDLDNLLQFAQDCNLMDKPFQEVYKMWQGDLKDAYESMVADDYLASEEFYDQCYLDTAVCQKNRR